MMKLDNFFCKIGFHNWVENKILNRYLDREKCKCCGQKRWFDFINLNWNKE